MKMIKTESLTHFYIKATSYDNREPRKKQDLIVCDNEYDFGRVGWREDKDDYSFYGKITTNGFEIGFYKEFGSQQIERRFAKNSWIYLGGVPTTEIHKK